MSNAYLQLRNISKSYGSVQALSDVTIDIEQGELVSFIGPSGCGKTTLLRTIGGFHHQDLGSITLDGENIDHLPPDGRPTGMVFQSYALFPHMSVAKNVGYGLKGVSKAEREERVARALSQVRLEGYGDRQPSELSGGQQQRVAIARCLVLEPKLLLLDEPLSNLDANLRVIMRDEIRRIKDELGITVLFVTHDQEEALSISDRILVLKDGVTQQVGTPQEVYDFPANEFVSNFVGHANIFEAKLTHESAGLTLDSGGVSFPVSGLRGKTKGEDVTLTEASNESHMVLVRPERIRINEQSPVSGELTNIIYNGSFTRYVVNLGDIEITADESNSARSTQYKIGDELGIELPAFPYLIDQQ